MPSLTRSSDASRRPGPRGQPHHGGLDDGPFEPPNLPGESRPVAAQLRTTPATPAQSFGDEEVHRKAIANPTAGLRIRAESRAGQRLGQEWRIRQASRIDHEVAVRREGCDGEIALAGMQVDRLRPREDHGTEMWSERLEAVEQDATRGDVQRIRHARTLAWPP